MCKCALAGQSLDLGLCFMLVRGQASLEPAMCCACMHAYVQASHSEYMARFQLKNKPGSVRMPPFELEMLEGALIVATGEAGLAVHRVCACGGGLAHWCRRHRCCCQPSAVAAGFQAVCCMHIHAQVVIPMLGKLTGMHARANIRHLAAQ